MANIIKYKNHELIINACSKIPKKLNYIIYFVGNDSSRLANLLKKKVIEFGLNNKIIFCGKKINPQSFLNNSDIGILVSNEEGFSNTILEYMSFGLPVIASKVGGNPESVKNNYNGFLIVEYI